MLRICGEATSDAAPETVVTLDNNSLQLEVLATNIPENVVVSVEGLAAGTQILAGAVELPEGATLVTDEEALVVNVTQAISEEALEAELAEAEAEAGIEREESDEEAAASAEAAESAEAADSTGGESAECAATHFFPTFVTWQTVPSFFRQKPSALRQKKLWL